MGIEGFSVAPARSPETQAKMEREKEFNDAWHKICGIRQAVLMQGNVDVERDQFQQILDDLDKARADAAIVNPNTLIARAEAILNNRQER